MWVGGIFTKDQICDFLRNYRRIHIPREMFIKYQLIVLIRIARSQYNSYPWPDIVRKIKFVIF